MINVRTALRSLRLPAAGLVVTLGVLIGAGDTSFGGSVPASIAIYQSPLTVAIPAHPQVVIAVANSESMDGNLSGAIMTGSGSLGASLSELQNTVSPANFTVPTGFAPPVTGGAAGSSQPYTVTVAGNLVDNSPSRLNMAKAGLTDILNNFMANTDFALIDYATGSLQEASTWVYYMSPAGANFSVADTVPAGSRGVPNPCYQVNLTGSDAMAANCLAMQTQVPNIAAHAWLIIGTSSDDANINDVLYDWSGNLAAACVIFGGPSPATPFPPNYSLTTYEDGGVIERYSSETNGGCATGITPTNAGYVPYSPQVMWVKRGFSYLTHSENASTANVLVGMATAGANPTAGSVTNAVNQFLPYLNPETNNPGTTEIKSASTQAPTAGLLSGALSYFQTVNPNSSNGCAPSRYVVLVTDGLPTLDLSGHAWPPLGSASGQAPPNGYGVTATWNADGSLATTNDQALQDAITTLQALNAAGIKTYIIGMGAGISAAANAQAAATLTAMAVAGGTGVYFPATDPTTLANDMEVILASIQAGTQSVATAAVNSTSIHVGSVLYQGQFSTSDSSADWSGNLFAFPVNGTTGQVNTTIAAAVWNAQTLLDGTDPNARLIATYDPVTSAGTPFVWTGGSPTTGIGSTTTLGAELSGSSFDASGSDALSFLRGVQSLSYSNGGPYRARAHVLGDIVDSAPLYIGPASGVYNSTSYAAFANTANSRTGAVYVGANDGMLHAFNANTGAELFAYIPRGVFANLINLTGRYYAGNHQFYVDASPTAGDVYFGGAWHTVLTGGEGGGGNSVYALDVTNPDTINTQSALARAVLWDFTDANMGLSYSRPAVITANAGPLVVFGNGYDSPTETPYLYALNAQTGAVVSKLNLCALVTGVCNASVANGLSSVTAANVNGDLSSPATLLYAGDLQGNLWRVDITNANPASWKVTVLFQARSPSGASQPITSTPAVSLNANYPRMLGEMVYIGTGQMLGIADLSTTGVQSVYGIYDNNTGSATPIQRATLVGQVLSNTTINLTGGGTMAGRTVTNNTLSLAVKQGWYVDLLLNAGERVVGDPQVDSQAVIVSSVIPSGNTCMGGDYSWLNVFNFANGGAFSSPPLSLTTQIISSVSLGEVFAATPRVEVFTNDGASRAILVTESGTGTATSGNGAVPIQDINMYGRSVHRTAWQELR